MRLQNNGQNGYLGIYFWNNGSPELILYKRTSGSWSQLGSPYGSGPLAAGTTLELLVSRERGSLTSGRGSPTMAYAVDCERGGSAA